MQPQATDLSTPDWIKLYLTTDQETNQKNVLTSATYTGSVHISSFYSAVKCRSPICTEITLPHLHNHNCLGFSSSFVATYNTAASETITFPVERCLCGTHRATLETRIRCPEHRDSCESVVKTCCCKWTPNWPLNFIHSITDPSDPLMCHDLYMQQTPQSGPDPGLLPPELPPLRAFQSYSTRHLPPVQLSTVDTFTNHHCTRVQYLFKKKKERKSNQDAWKTSTFHFDYARDLHRNSNRKVFGFLRTSFSCFVNVSVI